MIIPIIIMSGFGIYAWIVNGTPSNIPFLPGGAEVKWAQPAGGIERGYLCGHVELHGLGASHCRGR